MIGNPPEGVQRLTARSPFPRGEDGRPLVPDDLLERVRAVTNEEAWAVLDRQHGYRFQFSGGWFQLHPDVVLVGRAVTAAFVPARPDLDEAVQEEGGDAARPGKHNTWVIDRLGPRDALVVDLFGKVRDGTFIGDNLATAIWSRTGTGLVVEGGIRDMTRVDELEGLSVFARGVDPSAIADVSLAGVNVPVRVGGATVLPGDVVLGTRTGVTFIPPHLVEEVVLHSEDVRTRDVFGKQRIAEGRYTSGQIDVNRWDPAIETDFQAWLAGRG
ncbi:MAG TPA: RraA family protein [Actinopolymorphaceae bacterium]|nr:RraA family protein [Actinopolymorphaceae bacterium]